MMNLFENPAAMQVYLPVIVRQIVVLMLLALVVFKLENVGVSWKVAFQKIILKKVIAWVAVFAATLVCPLLMLPILVTLTNAAVLLLIIAWFVKQMRNVNGIGTWIYNLRASKQIFNEVFYFWENLLKNVPRTVAMAVIIASEPSILDMVISIAILIMITWGVCKFWPLSNIKWQNSVVQNITTVMMIVIAIMKMLIRIGMPMQVITVIIVIVAVIVGIRGAIRK